VRFAGVRPDVARLLRAFDALLFPSIFEGLPLVVLEAQAAALPIVLSDTITREVAVVPDLFEWRSLADPPETWATAIATVLERGPVAPEDALARIERSDFSLPRVLPVLERIYGAA
jgi:glycosyltransferase involved in cell wall biosynthesis